LEVFDWMDEVTLNYLRKWLMDKLVG